MASQHSDRNRTWWADIEAALPLRGRWLRYLICGFGIGAPLFLAPLVAGMVGCLVMAAGWLLLIQATVTYVEGRAKAARRSFSARLLRIAFVLILVGAAMYYLAMTIHELRGPSTSPLRVSAHP